MSDGANLNICGRPDSESGNCPDKLWVKSRPDSAYFSPKCKAARFCLGKMVPPLDEAKLVCGRVLGYQTLGISLTRNAWKCIYWRGGACADPEYCVFQVKKQPVEKPELACCRYIGKCYHQKPDPDCTRCVAVYRPAYCAWRWYPTKEKSHPTCKECKYWHHGYGRGTCCIEPGIPITRDGTRPQCQKGAK